MAFRRIVGISAYLKLHHLAGGGRLANTDEHLIMRLGFFGIFTPRLSVRRCFFPFARGVCLRSALARRGGFVSPRCWLVVVLRVSHWFWPFSARCFVSFLFFVRYRVLVDQGQNLEIFVVN